MTLTDISSASTIPKLSLPCITFSLHCGVSNLFKIACRVASILLVLSWFCVSSSSIFLRQSSGSISEVGRTWDMYSDMGALTREEGLSYAVCMEELWTLSCCLWFWMHLWWLWHIVWLPVFWWRDLSAVRATLECCGDYSITQLTEGKTKEKSLRFPHCWWAHIILCPTTIGAITQCALTLHYVDLHPTLGIHTQAVSHLQ